MGGETWRISVSLIKKVQMCFLLQSPVAGSAAAAHVL